MYKVPKHWKHVRKTRSYLYAERGALITESQGKWYFYWREDGIKRGPHATINEAAQGCELLMLGHDLVTTGRIEPTTPSYRYDGFKKSLSNKKIKTATKIRKPYVRRKAA